MIDVIQALAEIVAKWDDEKKCGWCWQFEAPMRESDLNESTQKKEECCTRVFATNYSYRNDNRYNSAAQIIQTSITHSLTLRFLRRDDIGLNVYSEQDGHPISESKWATILNPISKCVSLDNTCNELGYNLQITRENWSVVIDEYDANYTGWKVDITIIEK